MPLTNMADSFDLCEYSKLCFVPVLYVSVLNYALCQYSTPFLLNEQHDCKKKNFSH